MATVFVNGSSEATGTTAHLANVLLGDTAYTQYDLGQHKIYDYGQEFSDDEFEDLLKLIEDADTIVMGSPVYWHDLSGMMRNVLDRFYGRVEEGSFSDKRLIFIFQGAAPTEDMYRRGEYTMSRFASLYGMKYLGMVRNEREAREMRVQL